MLKHNLLNNAEFLFDKKHQLFFNFLKHTNQADNAVNYIGKVISEKMKFFSKTCTIDYLDVGCGYGYKTKSIIDIIQRDHTVNATGIDPSPELITIFQKQINDKNIHLICSTWEDFEPENKMHLITSIHTFYYITDWLGAINKMLKSLHEDGVICIAIRSNDPVCDFKNYFFKKIEGENKKEPDFEILCDLLDKNNMNYSSEVVESRLNITDCLQMNEQGKQLVEFLLRVPYSDLSENLQKEIKHYLQENHSNGTLLHQDGFVWIKKC